MQDIPQGTRLFQINENDLVVLEEVLPKILERQYPHLDAATRAKWRRVREIVCNVRWNYGPPIGDVTVIPAGDDLTPPA